MQFVRNSQLHPEQLIQGPARAIVLYEVFYVWNQFLSSLTSAASLKEGIVTTE